MIVAVIPTRYHPPTLEPLLQALADDGIPVLLYVSEDYNHQLHVMWNKGIREARAMGATEIALLNDDIIIRPGTMSAMADGLRQYDDAAVVNPDPKGKPSTARKSVRAYPMDHGQGLGYCFMLKAELDLPEFDENYHIWHGDLIFFEQVWDMGWRIVYIAGLYVEHLGSFSVKQIMGSAPLLEDSFRRRTEHMLISDAPKTGYRETWKRQKEDARLLAKLMRQGVR
jgi:GT2 family glycosyltransferase